MKSPFIWKSNTAKAIADIIELKNGSQILTYSGNPATALTAPKGSLVLDSTNGQLHVNKDGATKYDNLSTYVVYETKAEAKAATPVGVTVAYVKENYAIYAYCESCAYPADDDLILVTGNGGNSKWELIQKMSRTQGDTGWINTDTATISKVNSTTARLAISSTAAIGIKAVRIPVPMGNYDITISGVAGPKFIYFDDDTLVLKQRDTVWDFDTQCPVMLVYWSGTAIVAGVQTEFHGIRDTKWHSWAHRFLGTQYVSGLSFTGSVQTDNNTNPGADDTVFYLWSTAGVIQDEDVEANVGSGQWLQTLGSGLTSTTAGIFNHFYFNGSIITTENAMADRAPFIHAGANTPPQWNNGGTLTPAITGDYIVYHYFATPMVDGWSVFSRPHNAKYTSLAAALAASPTQLTWTNYAELKHIYTAVWRVNTSWSNTHQCKLVSLRDFRTTAGTPTAATNPTSHAGLSGLEFAGTGVTYGHINDQAQTIAGDKTFSGNISASNVVSGTYTPTLTRDANLDAVTAYTCIYSRVGSVVTVSGEFAADPTSASAATSMRMTLPIASNLTGTGDCQGVAVGQTSSANSWNCTPSASTDQALFACPATGVTGNTGYSFMFQYIIK